MKFTLVSLFLLITLVVIYIFYYESYSAPRPKAFFGFKIPPHNYDQTKDTPYEFLKNTLSIYDSKKRTLKYPTFNCTIYLSYKALNDNLDKLLYDAQKLTFNHTIKADDISSQKYVDNNRKIFSKIYDVTGNAASQIQFYATDSTKHFLTGALYFNSEPNYDSIYPIVQYLRKDIEVILKSLSWEKNP